MTQETPEIPETLALYVHWPFCLAKCPYCDFNSHVRESVDQAAWRQALLAEMRYYAALTPRRVVTSIFFGGGTPSLMAPDTVAAIIAEAGALWDLAPQLEITLEANPTSSESGKFRDFRAAGVNRLSIGIQALEDEALKFLGRRHTAREALAALTMAAEIFDRYSFDLIYARPGQSVADWRAELTAALDHAGGGHLSVYQLTIEEGTPFFTAHARGDFTIPDDGAGGALYEVTQEILGAHGLPAYEVSNHARPGEESRHNLSYWRYEDYAGIGPGAHGRLTLAEGQKADGQKAEGRKVGTRAHRAPEIWLERVQAAGHGAHPFEDVSADRRADEALMMGLRLVEGLPLARIEAQGGRPWRERIDPAKIAALEGEGYLTLRDDGRLVPSAAGLQRLHAILRFLQ